ncbi:MAG: TolC family protein [Bacteroidales bacterium]
MKQSHWIIFFCLGYIISPLFLFGQEKEWSFNLKEAQEYALTNNHQRKNSLRDIEIAKERINEAISSGLPQVSGAISNQNFLNLATTLIPDFIGPVVFQINENYFGLKPNQSVPSGNLIAAQFGTKYNASAEVNVNQLIFSGSYIVGLMASKAYLKQSVLSDTRTKQDIEEQIALAYYGVLVTQKNLDIFKNTLKNTEKLAYETEEVYKSGLIEDTDVDQLKLLVEDLKSSVSNTQWQITIAKNNLKLQMGIPVEDEIELKESLNDLLEKSNYESLIKNNFQVSSNINFQIIQSQEHLAKLNLKNEKTSYLPNISAFFNAKTNAMRNEYNFFDNSLPWYPTTVFGFQLNWSIWTSGQRKSKIDQAKLNLYKLTEQRLEVKESLDVQFSSLKTSALYNLDIYKQKKNSRKLAKRIYTKTQEKYKEGVSSSNDLLNTYNQYLKSEGDYSIALMNFLSATTKLQTILKKE